MNAESQDIQPVDPHVADDVAIAAGVHDLGAAPRFTVRTRLVPAIFFVGCTGLLVLAAWFNPSADGHGTHTQLGLPDCGFKETTGLPCPTCGCTTSFALAADGRVIDAFINQPFGASLAVLTAIVSLISGYALVTGLSLAPLGRFLGQSRFAFALVGILIAAWVYKMATMTGVI